MKSVMLGTAGALVLAATSAVARPPVHPAKAHPVHQKAAAHATLICPVTGTKIPSVKAAFGHTTYKGKTYYFCCPECKPRFDKNPQKFVTDAAHGKYQKM
ncbi:MAG: YHS domain-containing protein [Chloroflexi bacterium]|nr:YHS domain-containing protein [Chloroflexota bacterium]